MDFFPLILTFGKKAQFLNAERILWECWDADFWK